MSYGCLTDVLRISYGCLTDVLSPACILATAPVYDPTELSRANRVATVQRTLSRPDPDLATLSRQMMCMHHGAIWCLDTHQ